MQKYERSRGHNIRLQSATSGSGEGDVTFIGGGVNTTAGYVYILIDDGENEPTWALADNDVNNRYEGLLAVALGTNSSNGMLLRGAVTVYGAVNTIGLPLYLHSSAGRVTSTVPTSAGQVVRCVGYSLDASGSSIYFNPDSTFILIGE